MAATLPNYRIPGNMWLDANAGIGIPAGTAFNIQNIGTTDLYWTLSATEPTPEDIAFRVLRRGEILPVESGELTLWVKSDHSDGLINGEMQVDADAPARTAFGEELSATLSPISQVTAQYGLTSDVITVESNGGTVTTENSNFVISSGTDPAGLADVTSLRLVKYRAGLGLRCRVTALFETGGKTNSQQGCGLFTSEDGFLFGYIGTEFGIFRVFGGNDEAQRLTITTPAAGAEAATVTINGIAYPVNLTAGTVEHNAYQIATQLNGVVPDYFITSNLGTVTAQANLPGPQGIFAFTSATAVATWAQLTAGEDPDFDFTPQSMWSHDTVPWLDTSKGNVYQISLEYLGYGAIDFLIEEPKSGAFILVHRIVYANANVVPSASNPIFRMGWIARNTGNTESIVIKGASAAAFVDGEIFRSGPVISEQGEALAVDLIPRTVLILRVRRHFNGKINRKELYPLQAFISSQTTKAAFFQLLLNPTFGDDVTFQYKSEFLSIVEYAKENVTVSGGIAVGAATASQGDSQAIEFNTRRDIKTIFNPGDVIAIVARVSQTPASDMQVSVTWQED